MCPQLSQRTREVSEQLPVNHQAFIIIQTQQQRPTGKRMLWGDDLYERWSHGERMRKQSGTNELGTEAMGAHQGG